MKSASVVIPVKDGAAHLEELLDALAEQGDCEVLVIDSGSHDRSVEIARAAGAEVLEIPPADFGHGRTRNLGAERTTGELICFLTQDAAPVGGWLAAYREIFDSHQGLGAAYGPHLPRPGTSPMIARELTEFFASMSPDGAPVLHGRGDQHFLSNVNACYSRACWEEIRFPDMGYAEDQAFGRAMLDRGWTKAFVPAARVVHAHEYGPIEFARRYFDEYRGVNEAIGYVHPARPRAVARAVTRGVVGDRRWMTASGWTRRRRAAWTARSAVHHAGRQVGSALGSRANLLPDGLQRRISLEGRGASGARTIRVPAARAEPAMEQVLRLQREGPAPLAEAIPGMADRDGLHVAVAVPPFRRGSGGHTLVFELIRHLERSGHTCTVWLHDPLGQQTNEPPSVYRRRIVDWFGPVRAPVFTSFDDWHGADVALATGWETVYPLATAAGCRARAYLVSDHEPEFFPTSAQALWAARTYELGFFCISGGEWLHDLISERYGTRGVWYRFGVDAGVYHPSPQRRRDDTVLFYSRPETARRAVPLGSLALEELVRRRPWTRVVTFGQAVPLELSFAHEHLGVVSPSDLAEAYREATLGLCLSLTNVSLVPQEMMACGLPCVDLAGGSAEVAFGAGGPVKLSQADPVALADAMEELLSDPAQREKRSRAGREAVAGADPESAGRAVEEGLRAALRERERSAASTPPPDR